MNLQHIRQREFYVTYRWKKTLSGTTLPATTESKANLGKICTDVRDCTFLRVHNKLIMLLPGLQQTFLKIYFYTLQYTQLTQIYFLNLQLHAYSIFVLH